MAQRARAANERATPSSTDARLLALAATSFSFSACLQMGILDSLPAIRTFNAGRLSSCLFSSDGKDSPLAKPSAHALAGEEALASKATLFVYDHFQNNAKDGPSFDFDCLRAQVSC